MNNNNNNDDDGYKNTYSNDGAESKNGGASEAGILRGLAGSFGRSSGNTFQKGISILKIPTIGRLPTNAMPSSTAAATTASKVVFRRGATLKVSPPRPSDFIPHKVSVKQVVKVSDHVSQGISIIDSASESSTNSNIGKKNTYEERVTQFRMFASSLLKNTILGVVVFEVYGAFVDTFNPEQSTFNNMDEIFQTRTATTKWTWPFQVLPSNNNMQASVFMHTLGGFIGGSAHGVVATLLDSMCIRKHQKFHTNQWNLKTLFGCLNIDLVLVRLKLSGMIAHHGLSHAVLFGSYELSKRLILSSLATGTKSNLRDIRIDDDEHDVNDANREHMVQVEYLAYIFVAGGLSGQAQHVASHFTDKLFLSYSMSTSLPLRVPLFPLAMSFFPSGIAFVAFEYGKVSTVTIR